MSGRHLIIRCLNAEGKFSVASDLALEGMQIAMNDCSEYYALKFSLQIQNYISHEPKLDDRNLDIPIFADLVSKFAGNPFCKPLLVDCYLNLAEVNQDSKMKKDLLDTARKLSAGALDALKSPKAMTQSLICRVQSRIVSIRLAEDVKKACSDIAEVFQDASSMPPYSFGNLAYTSAVKMMECSVQFSQITEEWKLIGTTCKQLLSIVLANPVSLEALSNRKVQVLYRILISLAAETADRVSIIPLVMNSMSCTTMHLSEALATDERIKISLPADSEISLSYRLLESPIDLGAAIPIHLNDLAGVLKDNGSETMGLQLPISELVKLSKHLSKETQGFGQIIDWEESRHCSLLKLNALIKCNDESLNNVTYENVVADKDDKRKIIALGWIPYYQSNSMLRNSCDIIEHALAQLDPKFESGDDFSIMFICLNWPDSSIGNLFCTRKVSNSAIDAIKSMVANLLVTLARVSMSNLALLDEINWSWASLLDILSTVIRVDTNKVFKLLLRNWRVGPL